MPYSKCLENYFKGNIIKKFLLFFLLFILNISLMGCKLESHSRIKLSQLSGAETKIDSIIKVEITSCHPHDDNNSPSTDLLKANDTINKLFDESEFLECKNENMDTFASYNVPMTVGTFDGNISNTKGISVLKNKDNVYFLVSEKIRKFIKQSDDFKLLAVIRVVNDLGKNVIIYPNAVYVDKVPFAGLTGWKLNKEILSGKSAELKISNVSSDFAIENGYVPIFSIN
ncbi:MAG: hypothetical protein IJU79_05755 [Desulfovibrionaceae bacterium]|nr:hypothetical protein [Desulfovibrionaceae bacterium]